MIDDGKPKDPLAFDFGLNFKSAADRVKGEKAQRDTFKNRQLKYHISHLDDYFRSIVPNDLILLGAATGVGKTEAARLVACGNAEEGKNVFYFALEAEENEIERRLKFSVICKLAFEDKNPQARYLNFPDWYRGRQDEIVGNLNSRADDVIAKDYATLRTFYRGSSFNHEDLRRDMLAIQSEADLIIVDHLHYIDIDDDNENRGFKVLIKTMRDIGLGIGKPILMIAHLRKRDQRLKSLIPDLEMFHGSSDIIKVVTNAVMLAPAPKYPSAERGIANTFMHCAKFRQGGASPYLALVEFDRRKKTYLDRYTLGRQEGDEFIELTAAEVPFWGRGSHKAMNVKTDSTGL